MNSNINCCTIKNTIDKAIEKIEDCRELDLKLDGGFAPISNHRSDLTIQGFWFDAQEKKKPDLI